MSYGTHESNQWIEITTVDYYREVAFRLGMKCTSRGCVGQFYGEPADCFESEAPEFELDTVHVIAQDGNLFVITAEVFAALVGPEMEEKLIDAATTDAIESGDFG